ncbi:hypothetical protein [Flavobacterium oreochromis]|uniref:hypothetical protein n=1 Tax=Flavobacterium oreochromis TaxID=2906078 RepID=UPI0013FD8A19|nr:hypothetical protein [Flavobacterium oreochromis]
MNVSKEWLEAKIKELNDWLLKNENHPFFLEYAIEKQKRNYYVGKLIELEENELEIIKV